MKQLPRWTCPRALLLTSAALAQSSESFDREEQVLLRITRRPDGRFEREQLGRCRFVDLVGEHGWAA